jgi:hypothetical protein
MIARSAAIRRKSLKGKMVNETKTWMIEAKIPGTGVGFVEIERFEGSPNKATRMFLKAFRQSRATHALLRLSEIVEG